MCILTVTVYAQAPENKTITGTVSEASTGNPLAGARVQAYNNSRFVAMTDEEGRYSLDLPVYINALTVTLDGFATQQLALKGQSSAVDAALYPESFIPVLSPLTNVLNAGSAERFDLSSAISIESEIQSQLGAEVRTISRSGIPGTGAAMFIGGYNSLNVNAQPLIVLDDVILDQQYGREMLHEGYYNNILSNLAVSDIESITVLKNGTSLYGAKGANGVLLIKTKRNRSMVTR
ncbi:MAG: TonB-dependent receptor plug domain-containing protein, partial [Bacteroidales bacterium]|nr:TonB-dependent receptor plug domain-containing protein [Bacteroidales bacterium]